MTVIHNFVITIYIEKKAPCEERLLRAIPECELTPAGPF